MMNRVYIIILFLAFALNAQAFMSNDSCHQAFPVYCGTVLISDWTNATYNDAPSICFTNDSREGVWYMIEGTGDIINASLCNYSVDIRVLEGNCDALVCTENVHHRFYYKCTNHSDEVSFLSEIGTTYYLYCVTLNPQLGSRLEIECLPPAQNNFCDTPMPISIGDTVELNHVNASSSGLEVCGPTYSVPDLWYSFTGNDEYVSFSGPYHVRENFHKGACSQLECVDLLSFYNSSGFFAEKDSSYILQINDSNEDSFSFVVESVEIPNNDSCHTADPLILNDTTFLNLKFALRDSNFCPYVHRVNGVWYDIVGNDSIISFDNYFFGYDFSVYDGTCDALQCAEVTYLYDGLKFATELGQNYKLLVHGFSNEGFFTTVSEEEAVNNRPENAIPVVCGDSLLVNFQGATSDYDINYNTRPSLWYTMIGTGEFTQFTSVTVFRNKNGTYIEEGSQGSDLYYLEKDSLYYLNMTSWIGSDRILEIECFPLDINGVCEMAQMITLDDTLRGQTPYTLRDFNHPCGSNRTDLFPAWYSFVGDGQLKDVTFDNNNHYMSIFTGACDELICYFSGFNRHFNQVDNARIYFEDGVTYYFKIFARNSRYRNYAYELSAENVPIAENDICETALKISCDTLITDSLDFAAPNDLICGSTTNLSRVWYEIQGNDQHVYFYRYDGININSLPGDPILYRGSCDNLVCLEDELMQNAIRAYFWAEKDVTYYISFGGGGQPYTVKFECTDYLDNDLYAKAYPIECNTTYAGFVPENESEILPGCSRFSEWDDIWFSFEGTGDFLYIEPEEYPFSSDAFLCQVYMKQGEELFCLGYLTNNRLLTVPGEQYFFRFCVEDDNFKLYDYAFKFTCAPPASNDDCSEATILECNEPVLFDRTHATGEDLNTSCGRIRPHYRSIWFKVIGDDTWKEISVRDTSGNIVASSTMLSISGCDAFECISEYNRFFAEEGEEYLFVIYNGYLGPTEIELSCSPALAHDACTGAVEISCGGTVDGNLGFAQICDIYDNCSYSDIRKLWYKIEGTGNTMDVRLKDVVGDADRIQLNLYNEQCCELSYPERVFRKGPQHLSFASQLGNTYLVGVENTEAFQVGQFQLEVTCTDTAPNNCSNAPLLSTNQVTTINLLNGEDSYPDGSDRIYWPVSWIKFTGSGGKDTVSLIADASDGSINYLVTLDLNGDCGMSLPLELSVRSLQHTGGTRIVEVNTLPGQMYRMAVWNVFHGQSDIQNVEVSLFQGAPEGSCDIQFPTVINGMGSYQGRGLLEIEDQGLLIDTKILDREFSNFGRSFGSTLLNFRVQTVGTKILEYMSQECTGHLLFEFEKGECMSSFLCEDYVVSLNFVSSFILDPVDLVNSESVICENVSITASQVYFDCSHLGENVVDVFVTDGCDTIQCTTTVTVVDWVDPSAQCKDVVIYLDQQGEASLSFEDIDDGSYDSECDIEFEIIGQTEFTCFDIGEHSVELHILDEAGNPRSCVAMVEVKEAPLAIPVIEGPSKLCPGLNNIPFTTVQQEDVATYSWQYTGNGASINSQEDGSLLFSSGGDFKEGELQLVVSSYCGSESNINSQKISIPAPEFCMLFDCATTHVGLTAETAELLEALDIFVASEEIMAEIPFLENRFFVLRAGDEIIMQPGFEVPANTNLLAEIADCFGQ